MFSVVSPSEDILDSRDVIARIEELEELRTETENGLSDSEQDELNELKALASDGELNASDWEDGATLIREDYFVEYAKELAEDIGAVIPDSTWPNNHIDWEAAALELQQDYNELEYAGVTYLVRS